MRVAVLVILTRCPLRAGYPAYQLVAATEPRLVAGLWVCRCAHALCVVLSFL